MPTSVMLNGIVETSINQALAWSFNKREVLAPLQGKVCILHIQELSHVMCFHFGETRIEIIGDLNNAYHVMPDDIPDDYCWVSVSLFALEKLKQKKQLTALIKSGKLDFTGDLSILHAVSTLLTNLELDLEDVLSNYVGDAAAYQLHQSGQQLFTKLKQQVELMKHTLSDAALDEKPIAVRQIMVTNFIDEVKDLETSTNVLEARIQRLEKRQAQQRKQPGGDTI